MFTPINQVRLTNIALVRYKKYGMRFEIACYKNKVMDWRAGIETDLSEVLQSDKVYNNVSKGILAKNSDLEKVFDIADHNYCCRVILSKGKLQVSDKERKLAYENKFRDIATFVTSKCINSETNRPFPISMIENAMKEIHYNVNMNHSAKQQGLEVIKLLKVVLPIQRTEMMIRLRIPIKYGKKIKDQIINLYSTIESEDWLAEYYQLVIKISPGSYRDIDDILKKFTKGEGLLDIVNVDNTANYTSDIMDNTNGYYDAPIDYTKERII